MNIILSILEKQGGTNVGDAAAAADDDNDYCSCGTVDRRLLSKILTTNLRHAPSKI